MIILRQRNYSTNDTAMRYIDDHLRNSGSGGIIVPRKWSPNGKERSRNRQSGAIILPKPIFTTEDDNEKPLLAKVKKLFKKKEN